MNDLREKLETLCTELNIIQKTLKKAGKSRKKETLTVIRKQISEAAASMDKAIAAIEPERFCKPGVGKKKYDKLIETTGCYKCGCKRGLLVQWLSPNTGRALRRFSVVCENCWNLAIRERTIQDAIAETNKINWTLQK